MSSNLFDINRVHPVYQRLRPLWDFYKDSYKGGKDYIKNDINMTTGSGSYLYPHDNELTTLLGQQKFLRRHRRSFYPNYCRLPINTFVKYIFNNRDSIKREFDPIKVGNYNIGYDLYLDNINLQNDSMDSVMKRATINMLVYGLGYLLIDKEPLPENIYSLQQQIAIEARAFCVNLDPYQVVDWSIDERTKSYNWVLIVNEIRNDEDPFKVVDKEIEKEYILWTKTEIYRFNEEGVQKDSVLPNKLGFVPLIRMVYTDMDLDDEPESMLTDIAKLNREIYNAYSLYQEELYKLAFAQLMRQRGKDQMDGAIGDESDTKQTELSVDNVLNYPYEANAPEYLRFPVDALVEKRAYINDLTLKILQMANLDKQDGISGGNYLSGLAMAFSYNDTYYSVSELAQRLEYYENQVWDIIYQYDKGLINGEIQVTYPNRFDIMSDDQRRQNYELIHNNIEGSPTTQVLNDYNIIMETLRPDKNESEIIFKELEQYQDEKEQNASASDEAMLMLYQNSNQVQTQNQVNNQDVNPDDINSENQINQEVINE